ncbi:MAG: AAA family ATPase [Burkholderiaceae bacterium]
MIKTLAIENYRSIRHLTLPMAALTLITGANGSGKSNLYRSLKLLGSVAAGDIVSALAVQGGLSSSFWAGPEQFSRAMKHGEEPVQGGPSNRSKRLQLGFNLDEIGYAIALGLPSGEGRSRFALDPQIKRECIWAGEICRPASLLLDRKAAMARSRQAESWQVVHQHLQPWDSVLTYTSDQQLMPEAVQLRQYIASWRFYDELRSDSQAPARQVAIGTRTPCLAGDGHNLAAALQTIIEIGDEQALREAIRTAFEGAELSIDVSADTRFTVKLAMPGLLRPLTAAELSDGTLRFLMLAAALLSPRPAPLLVLNEPEASLHPDLFRALAQLIHRATQDSQVWVVSHATRLIAALDDEASCLTHHLERSLGETTVMGQQPLEQPPWRWPSR